jgi:hypothetical protein
VKDAIGFTFVVVMGGCLGYLIADRIIPDESSQVQQPTHTFIQLEPTVMFEVGKKYRTRRGDTALIIYRRVRPSAKPVVAIHISTRIDRTITESGEQHAENGAWLDSGESCFDLMPGAIENTESRPKDSTAG